MITQDCEIYVIGKGFVKPESLQIEDQVYTLDLDRTPSTSKISGLTSEWLSGKINCIDSGAHNVDVTDDSRLLYWSENHGTKLISFSQIPSMTRDKAYSSNKYLPVLTWVDPTEQNCTLEELEYIARMCAVEEYDLSSFRNILNRCSSLDAAILVDMLEFWCSRNPGDGWFGRVSVKSRTHIIKDRWVLDELCKTVVLGGYTAAITEYDKFTWGLKVSYESMPIPGSRPKNQKYFLRYYTGLVYNVNADNKPILGRSKGRCFYLPTSSVLNVELEKGV